MSSLIAKRRRTGNLTFIDNDQIDDSGFNYQVYRSRLIYLKSASNYLAKKASNCNLKFCDSSETSDFD